jgi:hypothetical protein
MEQEKNASVSCNNVFKSDSAQRREAFTRKMAELINQQERAKNNETT